MKRNPREPAFKKIPPRTMYEFRKIAPTDTCIIPELPKNRRCTDIFFLILFFIFIFSMVGWSYIIFAYNNVEITLHGYDSCDNICGSKNTIVYKGNDCSPQDFTDYPILLYSDNGTQCIKEEECQSPQRELFFWRCFPTEYRGSQNDRYTYEVLESIFRFTIPIIMMILSSAALSIIMYFCIYLNTYVNCLILIFLTTIFSALTAIFSWYIFLVEHYQTFVIPSLVSTIYLAALIVIFIFITDRFLLIVRLYAEATKAIFKEPILLVQPAVTIAFIAVVDATVIYLLLFVCLTKEAANFEKIKPWYIVFLFFMMYWLFGLANGCQCMIIAGVISAHYFTRSTPRFSYWKSLWVTIRYHLGSIAAGSLVILILRIVKTVADLLKRRRSKLCVKKLESCCDRLREIAEFLTKKAYIMTAIHGRSIYPSGERAVRLLWFYLCDMIAVDNLGCIIMHAVACLIIIFSMMLGLLVKQTMSIKCDAIPLVLGLFFAGTVTFFYVSLMNVTIETLILLYCEDRFSNDGSRYEPYFMTIHLHSLIIASLDLTYKENYGPNEIGVSEI